MQCNIRDISLSRAVERKNEALFAEKTLILKEVHHRIKHSMNTIKSLLALQAESLVDREAIGALKGTESRVQSRMVLYDKLYRSLDCNEVSIKSYLHSLIDEMIGNFPRGSMVSVRRDLDDRIVDASKGAIAVSVHARDGRAEIIGQDYGRGVPTGTNFGTSSGFGLMLVRMLTAQIGDAIRMEGGQGTKVVLEFAI